MASAESIDVPEPLGRTIGALALDVLALIASTWVWLVIAGIVLITSAALPPLFLIFLAVVIVGPGASWAALAPKWGRWRPLRWVIAPLLASVVSSIGVAPLAAYIADPGHVSPLGYAGCSGALYAILLVGVGVHGWARKL